MRIAAQRILPALAAAALLIAWQAEPASAEVTFCPPGSGAGQCQNAQGVAVDNASDRIYVVDRDNQRINVFEADGSFVEAFGWGVADGTSNQSQACSVECFKGIAGTGAGQFSNPTHVAVDNSGGAGQGDIYVVDFGNFRVQKFNPDGEFVLTFGGGVNKSTLGDVCTAESGDLCGAGANGAAEGELSSKVSSGIFISVGQAGNVFVADNLRPASEYQHRLQRFDPTGTFIAPAITLTEAIRPVAAFAMESNGEIWIADGANIYGYDAAGAPNASRSEGASAFAMDEDDHLFAAQVRPRAVSGSYRVVTEFDPSGAFLHRFRYTGFNTPTTAQTLTGLAVSSTSDGDIFGAEGTAGIKYFAIPPLGPIVPALSLTAPAESISNTKATLKAEVNPEGKATSYHFDYVDQESFESEGGFASPNTKSTPETAVSASGFDLQAAEAVAGCQDPISEVGTGKCLTPETTYRYRIVASNSDNESGEGEGTAQDVFTTKPPLEILQTYVTDVSSDTARLYAEINPLGVPTVGHFEYVDEETFQESGFAEAVATPSVDGLDFGAGESGTVRSVNLSGLAPGTVYRYRVVASDPLIEPIAGEERVFKTFESAGPPDGCPINATFRVGPSVLLPDCRVYEMVSPLDKENGDLIPQPAPPPWPVKATLDLTTPSGSKLLYGTYRSFGDAQSGAYTSQYVAAREKEVGWTSHAITPPRERLNLEGLNMLDTEVKSVTPDLCQAWLRTVAEPVLAPGAVTGFPNLYHRQDDGCGGPGYEALTTIEPVSVDKQNYAQSQELQGTSADGSMAIFVAKESFTEGLLPGTPIPAPQPTECEETGNEGCLLRLYRKSAAGLSYLCVLPGEVEYDGACSAGTGLYGSPGGEDRQASLTNAISDDGERVYWTASGTGAGKIYLRLGDEETIPVSEEAEEDSGTAASQFWMATPDGSKAIFTTGDDLYEFELGEGPTMIAEGVSGVMGASENGAYVYFASEDDLSGPNSEGSAPQGGKSNLYVSHNGDFSFIITLAGKEGNADAHGEPAPISVGPYSRLARVTPDGLHATFMSQAPPPSGYDNRDAENAEPAAEVFHYDTVAEQLVCVSCNPSGARPVATDILRGTSFYWAAAEIPYWQNALHSARPLSDNGSRLYFESTDALVLRDTNGVGDVYQWEEAGAGGCEHSDPTYSEAAKGCIDLISTGQSARASEFIDASASGDDVFFTTLQGLVSQDYGLVDIYDARVDGGLPSPPPPPAPCEGEACQSPAPPPPYSSPSSAAYSGPDNESAPPAARRCGAPAARAKRLSRRAKGLRSAARQSAPAAKRGRLRAARRKAKQARKLTRSAKRCRATSRNRGRSGR